MSDEGVDLQAWLAPIDGDAPCGEDLEYDPEFMAMERAATPKAEQVMGNESMPSEEPDWREVLKMTEALGRRHRDLRTVFHYGRAQLRRNGLVAGLNTIVLSQRMLEEFWDGVHPQLDPDDDNDPTARINVLGSWADSELYLSLLRTTPFVESPMAGRFSLRQLRLAEGDISPREDEDVPSVALIEGAASEMDPAELQSKRQALQDAIAALGRIESVFQEKANTQGPGLQPVIDELNTILDFLTQHGGGEVGDSGADGAAPAQAGGATGTAVATPAGAITTRDEAAKRLDTISSWFEKNEPSSPVPLLLRRAQRLVGKSFIDLVEDTAPDGVDQIRALAKIRVPDDD